MLFYGRVPCKSSLPTWSGGEPSSHTQCLDCAWQTRPPFSFSICYLLFAIRVRPGPMDKHELQDRTKTFAHRCVKLCSSLPARTLGTHIGRQLIRFLTSVAANYRAACLAQSKKDFESKLSRIVEEIDESCFWLEFIIDESLLKESQVALLLKESQELTAIFVAARKTSRSRSAHENSN